MGRSRYLADRLGVGSAARAITAAALGPWPRQRDLAKEGDEPSSVGRSQVERLDHSLSLSWPDATATPTVPRRLARRALTETGPYSAEPGERRWWSVADVAVMTIGVVTVFVATILWGLQSHGQVDPRDLGVTPATPVDAMWLTVATVTVVALLASAGLPRDRRSDSAFNSAVGQAAAAVAAGSGTLIGASLGNIWLYGPQDRCVFANCWPADAQAAAAAIPGVLTTALLMVMAVLVGKVTWRMRALVPAATWLVSIVVLRALWEPFLVPVFQAPPP